MSIRLDKKPETSAVIAEIVSEKVRVLQREQQHKVLDFVEQLTKGSVSAKSTRHIWEEVEEISARVPDEAWHDVPSDGSEQHDHYHYGAPKSRERTLRRHPVSNIKNNYQVRPYLQLYPRLG